MTPAVLLVVAAWAVAFGALSARAAQRSRRSPMTWAACGAVLGPIALYLLSVAPPGRCAACDQRVTGWELVCEFCGNDVRGSRPGPAATPALATSARSAAGRLAATPAPGADTPSDPAAHVPPVAPVAPAAPAARTELPSPSRAQASLPQPDADPAPARRLRERSEAAGRSPAGSRRPARDDTTRLLASGLFLTGSVALLPASRYGIGVTATRLRIVGPLERAPDGVAVDRELTRFEASVVEGRLVLTEGSPDRPRMFLVFESIAGMETQALVDALNEAVQRVPRAG